VDAGLWSFEENLGGCFLSSLWMLGLMALHPWSHWLANQILGVLTMVRGLATLQVPPWQRVQVGQPQGLLPQGLQQQALAWVLPSPSASEPHQN